MAPKFLAFLIVLFFEKCCPKQNTVARWKSKYLAKKIRAGYAPARGPAVKITLAWSVSSHCGIS